MSDSAAAPVILLAIAMIVTGAPLYALWAARSPERRFHRVARTMRGMSVATLCFVAAGAGVLARQIWSGNVHVVAEGEVYRSGQLGRNQLADLVRKRGIRSILNLRGANPTSAWYRDERAVAADLGVAHFDFRTSAKSELPRDDVFKLIALMRDAPKPLLIHCGSGADRTGLASALYLFAVAGAGEEVAERQLSPFYGHLGLIALLPGRAMDETWERYEHWVMAHSGAGPRNAPER